MYLLKSNPMECMYMCITQFPFLTFCYAPLTASPPPAKRGKIGF